LSKKEDWCPVEAFRLIRTTRELINASAGLPADHQCAEEGSGSWFPPEGWAEDVEKFFSAKSQATTWPWLSATEALERALEDRDPAALKIACLRLLQLQLERWEPPDEEPDK
jgi:hypothetical protein